MIDTGILWQVGWGAAAALVLGWLVVSFLPRGRAKALVARLTAVAMYVAFLCLFGTGFLRAEGTIGTIGFGFLVGLFAAGLLVSVWKGTRELLGGDESGEHAVH
ncbi:MAG: hypothetical protein JRH01_08420 [Deltaproteobacteria bacterium]|nr:hypothetical protein [Deltaproteobacteria bacterium]MBW2394625.1 hypothetical protein [Deltaproteobacteria bacterium]